MISKAFVVLHSVMVVVAASVCWIAGFEKLRKLMDAALQIPPLEGCEGRVFGLPKNFV